MKLKFVQVFSTLIVIFHITYARPKVKRAIGSYDINIWTNGTIPFLVDQSFSDSDSLQIQNVIDSLEAETCLTFAKYKPDIHPNWLKFEKGERCFSNIGMLNTGEQALSLSKACREYGLILHELGHTIGLLHEMMRPDRNQHIRYFSENIQEEAKLGFEIESNHYKLFNTSFDLQSIMMYSPYEFSKNGLPVWLKLNTSDETPIFDIREKDFSFWDIKAINEMYKCGKNCQNSNCPPDNFLDKNCVCQTPGDFAKRRCTDNVNYTTICNNASETNLCYTKPSMSSQFCRKTCGRCFRFGKHGMTFPPPYKCADEDPVQCNRNKNDGYCYFDTWTKVFCKKSCNKCSNHSDPSIVEFVCKDRHNPDLCEEWARNGQCDVNPGFMKANCALSCGSCSSNSTVVRPEAPCRNYSPDSYCDAIAREDKCNGTSLKVCLGSCGKCGSNYERNEANITEKEVAKNHMNKSTTECKDLIPNCEYFSNDGLCKKQKESMKFHCAKTCNFCLEDSCKNDDTDDVCDAVKQRGLCTSHAGFANRCRKTCHICKVSENNSTYSCKDHDSIYLCREILRRNQCNLDRGQRCRFTCNMCNNITNDVSQEVTIKQIESNTMAPCVNEDTDEACENLKERDLCHSYLDRAVVCRKSCALCVIPTKSTTPPIVCKNVEEEDTCNSWTSTGYCDENPEYMKENCAKSCKFCESNNTTESIPKKNFSCTNKTNSEQCNAWAQSGFCKDYADYMKTNCPLSCGACNNGSTTKVQEICKNTESDESCESWKDNYCTVAHIAEMCKKSCGICQ